MTVWTYLIAGTLVAALGGALLFFLDDPDDVERAMCLAFLALGGLASLIGCIAVGVAAGNRDSR